MSGIFPEIGVTAPNTINAQTGDVAVAGCPPLFYPNSCVAEVDPIALNAIMSEIVNVALLLGKYDCSKLDNMARAIRALAQFCDLPAAANVDLNDHTVGCFSGQGNAKMTYEQLRTLLGTCGLPEGTAPKLTDFVSMCITADGASSNVKVTLQRLVDIITGQIPSGFSGYKQGGVFHSDNSNGSVNLGARNAFFVIPGWNASPVQPGGLNAQWTVANITVLRGRRGGEDNQDYQPITGPLLFVRAANNEWHWVRPGNAWRGGGQTGTTINYNAIDNNDTGTIQFLEATPISAIA